jgi:hypothetical protein
MVSSNPNKITREMLMDYADTHAVVEGIILDAYERAPCETCSAVVYVPKKPGLVIVSVRCARPSLTHTVTVTNAVTEVRAEILIGAPYVEAPNDSSPPATP